MKEQIESGRLPDIVFCHNDGMATGAYKALVETGTEGKIFIYGIDGMPDEGLDYVQFGHQLASYVYPTGGGEIIRLALNILTGKPYERENKLDGILVVRENVWSISTTTKELMRQNENLVTIQDKLEDYLGLDRGHVGIPSVGKTLYGVNHSLLTSVGTNQHYLWCQRRHDRASLEHRPVIGHIECGALALQRCPRLEIEEVGVWILG